MEKTKATVEEYLLSCRFLPEDLYEWETQCRKDVIEHWASSYDVIPYFERSLDDFYFYHVISDDIAVIVHFFKKDKGFIISASSFDCITKECKALKRTGSLGLIFGRGHVFETLLSMLFAICEKDTCI